MPIAIYTSADPHTAISQDGTFTNPFAVAIDGKNGGVIQQRLYIRNDDPDLSYSGINLLLVDTIGESAIDGSDRKTWKLYEGDTQPTDNQWATVSGANFITFSGIGNSLVSDTSTYLPFWVRVEVGRNSDVETIKDVQLVLNGHEILV